MKKGIHVSKGFRTLLVTCLLLIIGPVAVASAQDNPPSGTPPAQDNPLSGHSKMVYGYVKMILLSSAEKMPEEHYSFKPTDTVRTYGQILGHVADSQYAMCSTVLGQPNPAPKVEQTKTTKADLVAAIKEACAYCDKAYQGLTDDSAKALVKMGPREMPKLGVLNVNSLHSMEHYGNLITYMRMKGIVPPTSEPGFGQAPPKK